MNWETANTVKKACIDQVDMVKDVKDVPSKQKLISFDHISSLFLAPNQFPTKDNISMEILADCPKKFANK